MGPTSTLQCQQLLSTRALVPHLTPDHHQAHHPHSLNLTMGLTSTSQSPTTASHGAPCRVQTPTIHCPTTLTLVSEQGVCGDPWLSHYVKSCHILHSVSHWLVLYLSLFHHPYPAWVLTIGLTSTLHRPTTAVLVRPAASATSTSLPLRSSDR
jgi:hypothetical protein